MTNQPTGDYRLIPWAYPPIPGGSIGGGGGGNAPYDFSDMIVSFSGYDDPGFRYTVISQGEYGYIVWYPLMFRDQISIDTSEVSQVGIWIQTVVANANNVDYAQQIGTFERILNDTEVDLLNSGSASITITNPVTISLSGDIDFTSVQINYKIKVYDESGNVIQISSGSVEYP